MDETIAKSRQDATEKEKKMKEEFDKQAAEIGSKLKMKEGEIKHLSEQLAEKTKLLEEASRLVGPGGVWHEEFNKQRDEIDKISRDITNKQSQIDQLQKRTASLEADNVLLQNKLKTVTEQRKKEKEQHNRERLKSQRSYRLLSSETQKLAASLRDKEQLIVSITGEAQKTRLNLLTQINFLQTRLESSQIKINELDQIKRMLTDDVELARVQIDNYKRIQEELTGQNTSLKDELDAVSLHSATTITELNNMNKTQEETLQFLKEMNNQMQLEGSKLQHLAFQQQEQLAMLAQRAELEKQAKDIAESRAIGLQEYAEQLLRDSLRNMEVQTELDVSKDQQKLAEIFDGEFKKMGAGKKLADALSSIEGAVEHHLLKKAAQENKTVDPKVWQREWMIAMDQNQEQIDEKLKEYRAQFKDEQDDDEDDPEYEMTPEDNEYWTSVMNIHTTLGKIVTRIINNHWNALEYFSVGELQVLSNLHNQMGIAVNDMMLGTRPYLDMGLQTSDDFYKILTLFQKSSEVAQRMVSETPAEAEQVKKNLESAIEVFATNYVRDVESYNKWRDAIDAE